ncbi:hypothetical protein TNCV_3048601 [Trichonephila clavipes]|nr:hypothetical protein TNCV_3048601 [Trichonephila clavipes]
MNLPKNPELLQFSNLTTLIDANVAASRRLINNNFKYFFPSSPYNASIITRLKTKLVKGRKISTDGQRSYTNHCPICPNVQLSPQHSCPTIQARLFKISPEDLIFPDKAVERLPKLSSTASERSKAFLLINLHIMDMSTTTTYYHRYVFHKIRLVQPITVGRTKKYQS